MIFDKNRGFYHGKEKWDKKLVYEQVAPYLPADLLEYVSNPKIIAIDIQAMSPEQIADMVDLNVLRAAFISLKNAHNKEFFQQHPEEILFFCGKFFLRVFIPVFL